MKQILVALMIAAVGGTAFADELPYPTPEIAPRGDGPAAAASGGPATEADRRRERLDTMFERLAKATNERRANRIARLIMRRMTESGSDTVDLLMNRAAAAIEAKNYGLALDYVDGVIRLEPGFAEGWNRRATIYFLKGDYGRSLVDIEQTLRLEPRHWGALAGLSMILVAVDRKREAVEVMERALEIHPFLPEMKERREKLAREVAGAEI
jgi:tetratricopeptide (TPR) repeat protein